VALVNGASRALGRATNITSEWPVTGNTKEAVVLADSFANKRASVGKGYDELKDSDQADFTNPSGRTRMALSNKGHRVGLHLIGKLARA
jgi:hypothetical protein